MDRTFAVLGAVAGCIAVGAGAFGAHALRARLTSEQLAAFETGVRYQMYHALALFVVAWASTRWPGPPVRLAGWLLVAGMLIFSGSLYALALTRARGLGALTPVGGLALLAGWIALAVGVARG